MSVLSWRRHGPAGDGRHGPGWDDPTVLALHAWGSTGRRDFATTGFAAALGERGVATLACDRPGHGDAHEVAPPEGAEPAAWTAGLVAADAVGWTRGPVVVLGHRDGALIAAHVAVRGEIPVAAVVLVGCDGDRALPLPASAAGQIADRTATVWDPAVSSEVARLREVRHDPATLAAWLTHAAWPATPRLRALDVPALIIADAGKSRQRERAPAWAACFQDGSVATMGSNRHLLGAPALHDAVADLAGAGRQVAGGGPHGG